MKKHTLHHHQAQKISAVVNHLPVVVVVTMATMICQCQRKGKLFLYKGKCPGSCYEEEQGASNFSLWNGSTDLSVT
jgi:hypothetical protein